MYATLLANTAAAGSKGAAGEYQLLRLAAQLAARLQAARTLHGGTGFSYGAAMLELGAYRQAFEGFLQATTTYRPLLLRVKAAYDAALRDAAASAHDNAHMRGELARAPAQMAAAVEEAHGAAERDAAAMARELQERLTAAEAAAAEAEREAADAEDQLARFQKSAASARRELDQISAANRRTQAELLAGSSWAWLARPAAAAVAEGPAGEGQAAEGAIDEKGFAAGEGT
ncbi:MAG: hypothetical protein J3K34DRAFT_525665 [Monoraphidium minutum]|nr:MAG: hypothetical protein J3K34DRAFT_525665 [Monoraphidium minutum]